MVAIGKIVEIIYPDRLWKGQKMECYATIQNIGDTANNIYFRMYTYSRSPSSEEYRDTGIQSIYLEPGQTTQIPLWDYENNDFFEMTPASLKLTVGHSESEIDDSRNFQIFAITITMGIIFITHPVEAPTGTPLEFDYQISTFTVREAEGVNVFMKVFNIDTGELLKYDEWSPKPSSRLSNVKAIMPDEDLNIRMDVGIVNAFDKETGTFKDKILDSKDVTVLNGPGGEGKGLIHRQDLVYPEKIPCSGNFEITLFWDNFGEIIDTIFAKIIDKDTGEILFEYRDEIQVNSGRHGNIPLTMPDRDLNVRIETGHDENGIDVVDDFEEFTIISFIPSYINIDTIPVKGQILVDGQYWGIAPTTAEVEAGTHTIIFGDVEGYRTPKSKTINIEGGDTINIIGEYLSPTMEAGFSLWLLVIPIAGGLIYHLLKEK